MRALAMRVARFGKFSFVGLMGAVLQVTSLDLLMKCGRLPAMESTIITVEIVLMHNFLWHERFTWRDRVVIGLRRRVMRFLRFHAGNGLVSLTGNTMLTYCLVDKLNTPVTLSAVISIALCAPVNYLLGNYWIYRNSQWS